MRGKISCFSSHSGRVWAVVLLDKTGMNSDFIKSWLSWMGDSTGSIWEILLSSRLSTLLLLSSRLLISCHYRETIVLHSLTLFLTMTARVIINSPSSKVKRGGKSQFKRRGGNPNLWMMYNDFNFILKITIPFKIYGIHFNFYRFPKWDQT